MAPKSKKTAQSVTLLTPVVVKTPTEELTELLKTLKLQPDENPYKKDITEILKLLKAGADPDVSVPNVPTVSMLLGRAGKLKEVIQLLPKLEDVTNLFHDYLDLSPVFSAVTREICEKIFARGVNIQRPSAISCLFPGEIVKKYSVTTAEMFCYKKEATYELHKSSGLATLCDKLAYVLSKGCSMSLKLAKEFLAYVADKVNLAEHQSLVDELLKLNVADAVQYKVIMPKITRKSEGAVVAIEVAHKDLEKAVVPASTESLSPPPTKTQKTPPSRQKEKAKLTLSETDRAAAEERRQREAEELAKKAEERQAAIAAAEAAELKRRLAEQEEQTRVRNAIEAARQAKNKRDKEKRLARRQAQKGASIEKNVALSLGAVVSATAEEVGTAPVALEASIQVLPPAAPLFVATKKISLQELVASLDTLLQKISLSIDSERTRTENTILASRLKQASGIKAVVSLLREYDEREGGYSLNRFAVSALLAKLTQENDYAPSAKILFERAAKVGIANDYVYCAMLEGVAPRPGRRVILSEVVAKIPPELLGKVIDYFSKEKFAANEFDTLKELLRAKCNVPEKASLAAAAGSVGMFGIASAGVAAAAAASSPRLQH